MNQLVAEAARQLTFADHIRDRGLPLKRSKVTTLQINLGKLCNQSCRHCHVDAGPTKITENMSASTVDKLISIIEKSPSVATVDITGGAPELNPGFRRLVQRVRALGISVIDRSNLSVFFEPGQSDTPAFLADNEVEVIASLPCYTKNNVDQQRGQGAFNKSIRALKWLNELGYGSEGSNLKLNLVYNPLGPYLPGRQDELEQAYKKQLAEEFEIKFHKLFTITNMPIKRFLDDLNRTGRLEEYMELLVNAFNPTALESVMCRDLVSVSWDGQVYDCDFNQMLELGVAPKVPRSIWAFSDLAEFQDSAIATGNHCFGCTAGFGSSCTGALR